MWGSCIISNLQFISLATRKWTFNSLSSHVVRSVSNVSNGVFDPWIQSRWFENESKTPEKVVSKPLCFLFSQFWTSYSQFSLLTYLTWRCKIKGPHLDNMSGSSSRLSWMLLSFSSRQLSLSSIMSWRLFTSDTISYTEFWVWNGAWIRTRRSVLGPDIMLKHVFSENAIECLLFMV